MRTPDTREVRATARAFADGLPRERRKQLGQYFTGVPLGKLLAHIALTDDARSVLDPMAGHGDLLDATSEAALERGIALERLDGIEIDEETARVCRERLAAIGRAAARGTRASHCILAGSVFDPASMTQLPKGGYDLVIANPPYVRYQASGGANGQGAAARSGLLSIVDKRAAVAERSVWAELAAGYSGLADLSVPAWLLAAFLVRPGGTLALVVPATWRSRAYGDVVRYLMLRCFELAYVVEDTQPGWFSDALVRTHLIVARKLAPAIAFAPLAGRTHWKPAIWAQVSPQATAGASLVGAAFPRSEADFAQWLAGARDGQHQGIETRLFDLREEWLSIKARSGKRPWYARLEAGDAADLPLFADLSHSQTTVLPEPVREVVGRDFRVDVLATLDRAGILVGQGLRTGCNSFFYVDSCGAAHDDLVRVRASAALGHREFQMPAAALRVVLRRQAEISPLGHAIAPRGRVLDLRRWVLPEDWPAVERAKATYRACGETPPAIMPDELASYVREAAQATLSNEANGKRIPELSAVRTNVRDHRSGQATPRFWYMLPDFAQRHLPLAFVPRINQAAAWAEVNLPEPMLIDANFSTIWAMDSSWCAHALKALFNSTWCQLLMEALGTPLGGGALKLEAAHLRHLPIPQLPPETRTRLGAEGRELSRNAPQILARIDALVLGVLYPKKSATALARLATGMARRAERLRALRYRTAA